MLLQEPETETREENSLEAGRRALSAMADQYGILPLELKRASCAHEAEDLLRKYGRMPQEARPWLPVNMMGPILVMAHCDPGVSQDLWGVPEFLCVKIAISEKSYEEILRDLVDRIRSRPLPSDNSEYVLSPPPRDQGLLGAVAWFHENCASKNAQTKLAPYLKERDSKETAALDAQALNEIEAHLGVVIHYWLHGGLVFNADDAPKQDRFAEKLLEKHSVYPLHMAGNRVYLLSANPQSFSFEDEWLSSGNDPLDLVKVLADAKVIRAAVNRNRRKAGGLSTDGDLKIEGLALADDDDIVDIDPGLVESIDPRNVNLTPEEIVQWVLYRCIIERASDLHIEEFYNVVRFRARIDGGLKILFTCPVEELPRFVAVIKNYAQLGQSRQECQDGRFPIAIEQRRVDVRVASVPNKRRFQKLVLRFLDKQEGLKKLTDLNLSKRQSSLVRQSMGRDQGLVLVTGPTGSGKTTTLYALIDSVNRTDVNIQTIEDPIEFEIQGINQTQTDPVHGIDFPTGLRSLMRADPDIILIGESRDVETAQAAIHAALTGHLVLTTLHANDCTRAVSRLLSMGIEPYLLADSLALTQAQRLVKRLCPYCKRAVEVTQEVQETFYRNGMIEGPLTDPIYDATGCSECHDSGYSGRVALMELTNITPHMADLIESGAPQSELRKASMEGGMLTLYQEGLSQVLAGSTSLNEISKLSYTAVGD
ncbi:MAG: GspE/PulE family protein [Verrucomicrobiota bacterium]